MQYPGTDSGMFGGGMGSFVSPTSLAARRQALIAKLAAGQSGRTAFPGSGAGGFGGDHLNAFADAMSGNGQQDDGNQFYGNGGVPTPASAINAAPNRYFQSRLPNTDPGTAPGGVQGGFNPVASVDPSWYSLIPSLAHVIAGNTFKAI